MEKIWKNPSQITNIKQNHRTPSGNITFNRRSHNNTIRYKAVYWKCHKSTNYIILKLVADKKFQNKFYSTFGSNVKLFIISSRLWSGSGYSPSILCQKKYKEFFNFVEIKCWHCTLGFEEEIRGSWRISCDTI